LLFALSAKSKKWSLLSALGVSAVKFTPMVPLAVKSYYSLMWGTRSPRKICAVARELGYRRLALTDTDNLYGLWPFLNACRQEGVAPIVGAELTDPQTDRRAVCLVESATGYRNLCRLITRRRFTEKTPFDFQTAVADLAEGLVVLTRDVDLLSFWHAAGVTVAGAAPRRPDGVALCLRQTARRLGRPVVATPDSFFLEPSDAKVHRLLRAIDRKTALSRLAPIDTAPTDARLAPPQVYARRFAAWPDTLRATHEISERLNFNGPPNDAILPPWIDHHGDTTGHLLRRAAYAGARGRYGDDLPEPVVDRLEHELRTIERMGFSSYFLVVRDIVSRSPRICGRGSGAASLVAYCTGITNVCPIKHNLYFERFLNPGRQDPPDIDVDFAWDERDAVLDSVLRQYPGHAAMVCTHVAFRPRMAIRETARVYGLTDREIGRVSKRLPWFWKAADEDDDLLTRLKGLPEMGRIDFPEPWPEIIRLAQRIIGLPRYISVHSGGMVITPNPIDEYVPVEPAPKGIPVIQWEKDAAEEAGLVKIDLLGNRSLGVIRDAIANARTNGIAFDEHKWTPEDDPATQETIAAGGTMGCFYIESPATRLLQQRTRVGDFEHIVIHSSIIRPAANTFIREYIRRLRGGRWEPIHPLLADVLDETYGIMVYQEDVSKTAMAVAGLDHIEADGLRKVLSRKDKVRQLRDYRQRFVAGARARGVEDRKIGEIWAMMMSFAGYSFCKPHSASFARVSFQSAFLKTHFPAEFMAAVISNQGGFYSTFAYVSEARRMGLKILPPDVTAGRIGWQGRGHAVRVGLQSVAGLATTTQQRIVACREIAPYRGLTDFLERVRPEGPEARSLIHAGAFDTLHPGKSRASLLWDLAAWQQRRSNRSKQAELFAAAPQEIKPWLPPDNERDRLRREFTALGFLCDRHPMVLFEDVLKNRGIVKAVDLKHRAGRRVRVAGLLITGKVVSTKHGEPMEFLTFEDDTGLVETTFFPEAYRKFCCRLDRHQPYLLTGKAEEDFGVTTLTVDTAVTIRR
jgi:error-prone DNA polymerase